MKDETPIESQEERHRRGCARLVYFNIGLVLLALLSAVFVLHKRNKITVSRETTYFTEPLDADGMVDYRAALNKRFGDVPKEENAAVVLLRIEPRYALHATEFARLRQDLELTIPPESHVDWQPYRDFIEEEISTMPSVAHTSEAQAELLLQGNPYAVRTPGGKPDVAATLRNAYLADLSRATKTAWTRNCCPWVADWLDSNAETLGIAEKASTHEQLFFPLSQYADQPTQQPLLGEKFPAHAVLYDLTRALTARAMLELGEQRYDDSGKSLVAAQRLAQLGQQHPMMNAYWFATVMESDAHAGHIQLATTTSLSADWYRARMDDLQPIPERVTFYHVIGDGERCVTLSVALACIAGRHEGISQEVADEVDWNSWLSDFNEHFDHLQHWANTPIHTDRWNSLPTGFLYLEETFYPQLAEIGVREYSQEYGDGLNDDKVLASFNDFRAPAHVDLKRRLALLAYALAAHRAEHGNYPEILNATALGVSPFTLIDPFDNQPLRYRKSEDGYVLYSVGINMKDDGDGRSFGHCLGNVPPVVFDGFERTAEVDAAIEGAIDAGCTVVVSWDPAHDDIGVVVSH